MIGIRITVSFCVFFAGLFCFAQKPLDSNWQQYQPNGSFFSLKVPSQVLTTQGHIFNPAFKDGVVNVFPDAVESGVYNFEINKNGRRNFLASILEIKLSRISSNRYLTRKEMDLISTAIGDNVKTRKVENSSSKNGNVTNWTFGKTVDGKFEIKGVGVGKYKNGVLVILLVSFDYAQSGDRDIEEMLNSLTITRT